MAELKQYKMEEHFFVSRRKKNTTRSDDMCTIFEEYLQELTCLDILLFSELERKQGNEDRNFRSIEVSFKLRMHGPFSRWLNLTKSTRSYFVFVFLFKSDYPDDASSTIVLLCTRKQQTGGF